MELTKFSSDISIVTVSIALLLVPRAFDTYLALREQHSLERTRE